MRGERVDAERVPIAGQQRQDVIDPAAHVRLPHPQRELLVEQLHHVQRVLGAAVDTGEGDRAAATHDAQSPCSARRADRCPRSRSPSAPARRERSPPASARACRSAIRAPPCRPRRSRCRSRGRPCVPARPRARRRRRSVDRLDPMRLRAREAIGHQVQSDHLTRAPVLCDPARHLADRAEPDHRDAAAVGDLGVVHGLPRGGQDVRKKQKAVIRRAFGHLDRPVLGLRDAQQLGLPTGHLAVELRVAEQRSPRPCSRTCVVSHCDWSPWPRMKQWPQEMLNGTTTRSPTAISLTSDPHRLDDSHRLWPRMSPSPRNGPSTS